MNAKVTKLTGVELLKKANSFTSGRESKMSLAAAYRHGHSPIRTQLFWVELRDIPLFVASQLVRSHVGVQFFQLSKRTDRGGTDFREVCRQLSDTAMAAYGAILRGDKAASQLKALRLAEDVDNLPDKFDRYAPTDLAFIINAEALINMSHKRLCCKASKETREIVSQICDLVEECDPELAPMLVSQCIYRGGICPEPKSCGWIKTEEASKKLTYYTSLFT